MNSEKVYETVSEAVNDLLKRGYTTDFLLLAEEECIKCKKNSVTLSPDAFEIDETHRFEGITDPGDEMIVFAISSKNHKIKGTVVNGYGVYSDSQSSTIVEHLKNNL